MTEEELAERRKQYYAARTPEQRQAYKAKAVEWHAARRNQRIAARATAGLQPYQKRLPKTAAELEAGRVARANKRREKRLANLEAVRESDRIKARRLAAARAETDGRPVVLDIDRPKAPLLTEEEKRERRRIKAAKWREANRERAREIGRKAMKWAAAERALAEGREPGRIGRPKQFTEEERRAKRKEKTERWNAANAEIFRERARLREAAKRAGTFVSRALPRLTEEEARLVQVAMSANRRARIRAVGGKFTKEDIANLLLEQNGLCAICNDPFGADGYHIDHWKPLSRGGTNDPSNLKLTHPKCNLTKGA